MEAALAPIHRLTVDDVFRVVETEGIDLEAREVVVRRYPAGDAYRSIRTAAAGEPIEALAGGPVLTLESVL